MKVYKIECRTGCSCCSEENHYRGLYETKEEAQARIDRFKRGIDYPLASQYSIYGNYTLEEFDAEEINGNRLIIENKVYTKEFVKIDIENGELLNTTDDYLETI